MKAQVAVIDLGFTQFDGLMMPDGDYAIAVPQIATLISLDRNQASREFKRLLGSDFSPSKTTTEYTKAAVNIVDLSQFFLILYEFAKRGDKLADSITKVLLVESIERRYDTAFGKKVSEAERNEVLALRMKRLMARHAWTDVLRDRHVECFGEKPTPKQYRDWTVLANEVLFNKKHFNCDRDNMDFEEQRLIEHFEYAAARQAKLNPDLDPDSVLGMALNVFS